MNFGSFGMIIGHEISHGFDPHGKFFDHKGDARNTWTENVDKKYNEKISCYIKHYNGYYMSQVIKMNSLVIIIFYHKTDH